MEQILIRKKEEKERIKKLEDEIIECEFVEWLETTSETQRNEIVGDLNLPSYIKGAMRESTIHTRLKEHFIKNVKSKAG